MAKVTATKILEEAIKLKEKKSKDYQGSRWSEEDYFPFGNQSYMHMIHTKYLRMRNLLDKSAKDVNFESLEDTLTDMAIYCAMFQAYLENKRQAEVWPPQSTVSKEQEKLFKTYTINDLV